MWLQDKISAKKNGKNYFGWSQYTYINSASNLVHSRSCGFDLLQGLQEFIGLENVIYRRVYG
jgi:hypothetical protein